MGVESAPRAPMTYAARFRTLLALFACLAIAVACGGGGAPSAGTPRLYLATSTPADGASDVSTTLARVVVTFSLPLDPTSVAPTSLRIAVPGVGDVPGTTRLFAGSGDHALEFVLSATLTAQTTHEVLASPLLRSTAGDVVGGVLSVSFRTGGSVGPGPVSPSLSLRATLSPLQIGRRRHTATRLTDGRVLMCGGFVAGTAITNRAEIFTPLTESFTLLGPTLKASRAGHTATRLADGRVLLTGGWRQASVGQLAAQASAEVFDPATGEFTAVGAMSTARVDHAAGLLPDGRVLVTGGSRLDGSFLTDLDSVEVFDPSTDAFSAWATPMTHTRATHGLVDLADGRWLLVGGSDLDLRPETFDVGTGAFTPFAAAGADQARFGVCVAAFGGDVAVVGGEASGDVLHFDRPSTRLINTGSPTSTPRAYATATRIGADRVIVAGGIDNSNGGFLLSTLDLVVEGGVAGSSTYPTALRFPTGMVDHTATPLQSGLVLYAGGLNQVGGQPELDGAYLLRP